MAKFNAGCKVLLRAKLVTKFDVDRAYCVQGWEQMVEACKKWQQDTPNRQIDDAVQVGELQGMLEERLRARKREVQLYGSKSRARLTFLDEETELS